MLTLERVNFDFGASLLFRDLSIAFPGSRHLLLGPNGSGKTSLMAIIAGLYRPLSGQILWHNTPMTDPTRRVSLCSALMVLPDFISAGKLLKFWEQQWQPQQADMAQRIRELTLMLDFLPQLGCRVGHLSSGNLQKLKLIMALSRPSDILLLDEAHSAMDSRARDAFWRLADSYSGLIIATSHEGDGFIARGYEPLALDKVKAGQ